MAREPPGTAATPTDHWPNRDHRTTLIVRAYAGALIEESVTTPLRQRMLDAMALRGLATRTVEACIRAVVGLSR